jgi:hypothetical protein
MTIRKLEVPSPWGKVRKRGGIQEAVIMSHSKHGSTWSNSLTFGRDSSSFSVVYFGSVCLKEVSQDNIVSIATGCGLGDRGVRV